MLAMFKMPAPFPGYQVGGPSTVLRCSGFASAAPAAQDDSYVCVRVTGA